MLQHIGRVAIIASIIVVLIIIIIIISLFQFDLKIVQSEKAL